MSLQEKMSLYMYVCVCVCVFSKFALKLLLRVTYLLVYTAINYGKYKCI